MDNFAENVSKHFGLPWTSLIAHCKKTKKEKPPDEGGGPPVQMSSSVTTRLQSKDACTFGFRPALDEFLLTICDICGAVIKPQALRSHIERRHKDSNDESSVQHLATEKPIIKGQASKSKSKNSPRNSPKLSGKFETNLLDKYKLPPKPPLGLSKNGGKITPGSLEKTNSAIAWHLSSTSAQPIISLDDVGSRLNSTKISPSSSSGKSESRESGTSTPRTISHTANSDNTNISTPSTHNHRSYSPSNSHKKSSSKRNLDISLADALKAEMVPSPKKLKSSSYSVPESPPYGKTVPPLRLSSKGSPGMLRVVESSILHEETDDVTPPPTPKAIRIDSVYDNFKTPKDLKDGKEPKLHHITTIDKNIPCKEYCREAKQHVFVFVDREYDPDRHCGCWLEEWGKHCTRSLTCKSHALSLRRRVAGRSKPFDQLLQEHRDAKEALLQAKPKKASGASPTESLQKSKTPSKTPVKSGSISATPDTEMEGDPFQCENLGYSSFHPRPLAAPSYGARLCGNSYVPNRQMDFLRMAIKCAIEKPKQIKKSCSTKSKSVNGASALSPTSQQLSLGRDLPMSSLSQSSSIYNKTSAAKRKPSGDKKKKVTKRASTESADHSTKSSPPYSHRMTSPASTLNMAISSPPTPQQLSHMTAAAHPLGSPPTSAAAVHQAVLSCQQSPIQAANPATIGVLSNGTTQYYRANVLKDLGIRASMQKVQADPKLNSKAPLHLTTNSSGIATLTNKHNLVLDGLQYALYNGPSVSKANEQGLHTAQPVLFKGSELITTTNGMVMQATNQGSTQHRIENQPTLMEIIPQQSSNPAVSLHQQHVSAGNIRYIKSPQPAEGQHFIQSSHSGEQKYQQFNITNGANLANFAMQIKQQNAINKPNNVSLTIPLVSQPTIAQQQVLHSSNSAAAAHQGFS